VARGIYVLNHLVIRKGANMLPKRVGRGIGAAWVTGRARPKSLNLALVLSKNLGFEVVSNAFAASLPKFVLLHVSEVCAEVSF